jgi:hypothetical protein
MSGTTKIIVVGIAVFTAVVFVAKPALAGRRKPFETWKSQYTATPKEEALRFQEATIEQKNREGSFGPAKQVHNGDNFTTNQFESAWFSTVNEFGNWRQQNINVSGQEIEVEVVDSGGQTSDRLQQSGQVISSESGDVSSGDVIQDP